MKVARSKNQERAPRDTPHQSGQRAGPIDARTMPTTAGGADEPLMPSPDLRPSPGGKDSSGLCGFWSGLEHRPGAPACAAQVAERRGDTLLNMMLFIEMFTLNRAWSDLSQDEFFWEPVPGSWSVRRREECSTPNPFGTRDWVVDFDDGRPDCQGHGYGRSAMRLAERLARENGALSIGLNVFAHNWAARHLYVSLGYAESRVTMRKQLETDPG